MYCKLEHQKEGTGLSFSCFHWQTRSGQDSFSWGNISSSCTVQLLASWRSKVWGIGSAGMGDSRHALVLMLAAIVVNACLLLGCKTGICSRRTVEAFPLGRFLIINPIPQSVAQVCSVADRVCDFSIQYRGSFCLNWLH